MTQKIIQVGNSAAVTIPKPFLQKIKLSIGDEVEVESDQDLKLVIIRPKGVSAQTKITPEFKNWLDSFIKKNQKTLQKLSQV